MALNLSNRPKSTKSSNRTPQPNLEVGGHAARLVQIIDLGLQAQRPYKGQEKPPADMMYLTYELSHDFMKDEKGEDNPELPRWISEEVAVYGLEADKAKSTLRYRVLDPREEYGGDFSKLVGAPCTVVVVHNAGSGANTGKIFDNIGAVTPAMKIPGYIQPDLVNPPAVFDLSEPNMEVFAKLPAFLQDKIKGNLNYNGSALQKLLGGNAAPQANIQSDNTGGNNEPEENPY